MASGASVKLGVEGVSQFKTNMNQAKQAVKTLDTQLTLTEKQFKATGDSESYMTEKAELLKAKLEQQKTVVANAEKALDDMKTRGISPASTAYQKLYQEMIKAKGEMLDTETAMNGIAEAGETAADEVDAMNTQLSHIGGGIDYQNVISGLDSITGAMGSVITKAWKMGEAIIQNTLGAGSWADELMTTAAQYEDTLNMFGGGDSAAETLQRMRKTATLIDTDVDTILAAQDKLKKNREKQDTEFMGALAYLGIDPTGKNDLDLFWEFGEAIANLGDEEDKVSYAQKAFGKSWRELLPLFTAGRDEYEQTMDSWNVVEDEQLDALGKMDDQYQKMTQEWETFKNEMLSAFSGPLTEGMETITGLFEELNKYLDTPEGQAMLAQIGETVSGLITDLTSINPEELVAGIKGVLDGVVDSLRWIAENRGSVVTAVEAFIGVWAGLKAAKGVTTVMSLVNSIKGLTAGSAAAAGATAGSSWAGAFASAAMKAAPFLAFLYTMLNPSSTATDDLDKMFDENGELTTAGKKAQETNGESLIYDPNDPKYATSPDHTTIDLTPRGWGSDQEKKYEPVEFTGGEGITDWTTRQLNSTRAWEEMKNATEKMEEAAGDLSGDSTANRQSSSDMSAAAGTLKGMPGQMEEAIIRGMSGIKIYIDGQQAGNVLTPYVNQSLAGFLAELTK